ncbi:hypothetical protein CDQ96_01760 [Borrelia miyamotoi]|nr:hypothetical protein CDQ96_01760 [Borrelia miyamotoi]
MLKTNHSKIKGIIAIFILILQVISSLLILSALYGFTENTMFISNSSIKFMIAFIIFSPELFVSILTIHYILYEQFKILHNLITITKTFQIIMCTSLIILGLSLNLLYLYQIWSLVMLAKIVTTYIIFNSIILILIKKKDKMTE